MADIIRTFCTLCSTAVFSIYVSFHLISFIDKVFFTKFYKETEAQKRVNNFAKSKKLRKQLVFYFGSVVLESTCSERRRPKKEPPEITKFKGWVKEREQRKRLVWSSLSFRKRTRKRLYLEQNFKQ